MSDPSLMDLRLADVEAFLAVCRAKSVSNVARQFGVTPSQVSKAIARLERHLQLNLLERSGGKIVPSTDGNRLIPRFDEVVKILRSIRAADSLQRERLLTIASPSYLQGPCLAAISGGTEDIRLRGVELGPSQIRGFAPDGIFDIAVTTSNEGFGESWHIERMGDVRSGLFGMPSLVDGLGTPATAEQLSVIPFITPKAQGSAVLSDDGCPIRVGERPLGHEVQTFGAGLELATQCPQVVFGPILAARSHLERGVLKLIDVEGWDVRVPLFLVSNVDRVMDSVRRSASKSLGAWLEREG
jgi:DNA-binding transcriptional LysR family regulator